MQEGAGIVTLQGIDLQVTRRGSGPPLLLLHGGGGPQHHLPFFQKLTEHFDVIAPIHPGFAGSAIPAHFDGMEDLVYLHLDLMDALDLRDVMVVGMSMGGWAAAEMAVRNTSRMAKLILVDAVGIKTGDRESRDIADIFGLPQDEITRLWFHDPANATDIATFTDAQLTEMAASRIALAMYTWEPYMHNPKLRYRLHRIQVPTLLIWGESDGLVPVAYAEAYRALIPGAELVVIPQAGHAPQVEQPDLFCHHVYTFAMHTEAT
jgi:pimeloyl-ACP methyl ester carboxylesterase